MKYFKCYNSSIYGGFMMNIAIIGSTGAIGEAFVNMYVDNHDVEKIYSYSRSDGALKHPKIINHYIDIEDYKSIETAASIIDNSIKLDIIIVATGILSHENINPEKSLKEIEYYKFKKLFSVNTIGPALIAKYFSKKLNKESKSMMLFLSARVGSISDNMLGGWYAYRASKAALNMTIKNLSIEMARVNKSAIIAGLHPGTVDSKLSAPFKEYVKKTTYLQHNIRFYRW